MATYHQPMALSQLQQFLANGLQSRDNSPQLQHIQAAADILGMKRAPYILYETEAQLQNASLVGLDMEWFESGPKMITEIGVSVLRVPKGPFSKPLEALNNMDVHHMRLQENAHMVNGEKCPGHPEEFQFGPSSFVDVNEARQALADVFLQYDADGNVRPVILFGHAVDNDLDVLREKFGFDLAASGVVVMILDTQVMARELGLESGRPMSLKRILAQYSVEEKFLHNAGNDVAQTMVAASLLAGEYDTGRGRYDAENQGQVDKLKALLRNRSSIHWGIPLFCTNCNSITHLVSQCPGKYLCTRCANNPQWADKATTHPIEKCVRPALPCKACIESDDPKRQEGAVTHYVEDCFFEKGKSGLFIPSQHSAK